MLDANERTLEEQAHSLRMTAHVEAGYVPTVLGVIGFSRDPRRHLPCDYVQFLRFEWRDLTSPVKSQREIDGPLSQLLSVLDETFRAHISIGSDVTSADVETKAPDIPLIALQQIARNAVLHRNYEGTSAPVRTLVLR